MRDQLWRRDQAAYPIAKTLPVLFADIDAQRHVNNIAVARYVEESRMLFAMTARNQAEDAANIPRARIGHVAIDYLGEIGYPADVVVATGISAIGRTSYTLAAAVFVGEVCAATASSVLVCVDEHGPTPIAEVHKGYFSRFTVRLISPILGGLGEDG
jgi:acyl-CoA thioester hydrolase